MSVVDRPHLLEGHPGKFSIRDDESLRDEEIQNRNAFVRGVFLLPRAGLHLVEARPHYDFYILAADAPRGAAAVHRGVAAAEDDDALSDLGGVAEGDRGQPVD